MTDWMLYGATGYTGRLIIEEALRRGQRPLLAGRSEVKLKPLAEQYGLNYVAFDLDAAALFVPQTGIRAVLHAAGPFIHTSAPMVNACLSAGIHYLDITGEIPVFEAQFARDAEAQARGIVLLSGIGFDVVPSDCLAKYVAERVEGAQTLEIVINALSPSGGEVGMSAGTLKSMIEMLPTGGRVRRAGKLLPLDFGAGARTMPLAGGDVLTMPIPWGDVSTAYYSTGIPNITVYAALEPGMIRATQMGGFLLQRALGVEPLRRWLAAQVENMVEGPSETLRTEGRSRLYARATAPDGRQAEAWMETAEGYAFTARSSVLAVERVLAGQHSRAGTLTPSMAFGADFVLEIEGSRRYGTRP